MIDINKVPKQVLCVLELLENEGYYAYLVGGSVRDILLGRMPHDFDIATNAPLKVLQSLYTEYKIVGATFGVVLIKVDGLEMQVAKFRTDGEYNDYRHPNSVNFTNDIMEDLQRRDFTINAIAMDGKGHLSYVDDALEDLNNSIIRAVGNPEDRFKEDALRILRGIRFSCQLGFSIEKNTDYWIGEMHCNIKNLPEDRIREELNKILLSNNVNDGLYMLRFYSLMRFIVPEMTDCYSCDQNNFHKYTVFGHIVETVKLVPNDLLLRLTALFHDIGKPKCKTTEDNGHVHFYGHDEVSADMAKEIMIRLKYDSQMIDEVTYLVRYHMELMDFPTTDKGIRKLLNRHGEARLKKLVEFRRADLLGSGTRDTNEIELLIQGYRDRIEKVLEEKPPTKLVDLAIDGNDIMEITGLKPGKEVGEIKDFLMEVVLEHPQDNNIYDLSEFVKYYQALNNLVNK
jgi:tRNA nucleotidyltransferase (CCA-adding enzyme)